MSKRRIKQHISITGPLSLLKAMEEELKAHGCKLFDMANFKVLTEETKFIIVYEDMQYTFLRNRAGYTLYTLPAQWDEVLAILKEATAEVVIPEYVKVTVPNAWYKDAMDKVFKVKDLEKLHPILRGKGYEVYRNTTNNDFAYITDSDCVPATKEEFDSQASFKKGQFYLGGDSGANLFYISDQTGQNYTFIQQNNITGHNSGVLLNSNLQARINAGKARIISDTEALELLKSYYATKGFVVGALITTDTWKGTTNMITGFDLVKNIHDGAFNTLEHGDSQLAIQYRIAGDSLGYISVTATSNVRVTNNEVYIDTWKVEPIILEDRERTIRNTKGIWLGCIEEKWAFTEKSLKVILQLMKKGNIKQYRTEIDARTITFSADQVEAALKLLEK